MTLLWATHLISLQNGKSKDRGRRVDAIGDSTPSGAPAAEDGLENARKRSRITDPPAYAAVWVPECGEACNVLANKTSFLPVSAGLDAPQRRRPGSYGRRSVSRLRFVSAID